jgi:hypothetical protein
MLSIPSCFALDLRDDVPIIECSGYRCPGDNWFHLECLGLDQDDVLDDDFYCSEGCKKRRAYKYCCNVDLKEPMVTCDNDCCKTEWFHMKCVGLKKSTR